MLSHQQSIARLLSLAICCITLTHVSSAQVIDSACIKRDQGVYLGDKSIYYYTEDGEIHLNWDGYNAEGWTPGAPYRDYHSPMYTHMFYMDLPAKPSTKTHDQC